MNRRTLLTLPAVLGAWAALGPLAVKRPRAMENTYTMKCGGETFAGTLDLWTAPVVVSKNATVSVTANGEYTCASGWLAQPEPNAWVLIQGFRWHGNNGIRKIHESGPASFSVWMPKDLRPETARDCVDIEQGAQLHTNGTCWYEANPA